MADTKTVLVLGGTSDIGRATALRYAEAGWAVQLAARDAAEGERVRADIATRTGVPVTLHRLDILDTAGFGAVLDGLPALPDTAVCVIGLLGEQARSEADPAEAARVMRSNFEGPALLLEALAARFAARGRGTLVGVSSVAGDRGRASNYVYGAAKAGLTAYLAGMRHRLARLGVTVITVKPGFVRTRMTAGMPLPGPVTAAPREVAEAIFRADARGRPRSLYVRRVWWPIMTLIRLLPEPVFLRTRL
ncbi:SDR family oxidoreductase [Roseicella aquatilis]|uniref:SDR family oxidoreductase n=1 Tax=Roseicella aquatilis TaxID=2527868 RepID=A0A4R4D260_9PROT|nr:SDR family oxidoreductase [Roseicella aquatilis]TCZ52263.1 SDR family oxidoreductase [Roseicella aquatilis]